jgi:hypothetical protein
MLMRPAFLSQRIKNAINLQTDNARLVIAESLRSAAGRPAQQTGHPERSRLPDRDGRRQKAVLSGQIISAHKLPHLIHPSPANEAVEMVDHERSTGKEGRHAALLTELIGGTAWEPTFMFYMGYAVRPGLASPRRPVEMVVR